MTGTSGSWQPDPTGRHQLRWWDGAQWTSQVSDNGVSRDENAPQYAAPPPAPMMPYVPSAPAPAPARSNRGLIIAIVVAVALVAGGVIFRLTRGGGDSAGGGTGDSQTAAGRAYVDAMIAGAAADSSAQFTPDELKCMAESVVDEVGVKALQDAGITPDAVRTKGDIDVSGIITQPQAATMADKVAKCIDFSRAVTTAMAGSDVKFTQEQTNCIGEKIGASDLIREMFVQSFMGTTMQASQQAADALGADVVGCIDFGQLVADALATSGIQLDANAIACVGDGMKASEFVKQSFVQQFLGGGGGGGGDTTATSVASTLSAANDLLHSIVGNLFGAADAATTDAMTKELSGIFTNCGVNLGG